MLTAKRLLNIVMQNKESLSNTDDGKCTCQNKAYNIHVQKVVGVLAYFYHTAQHHVPEDIQIGILLVCVHANICYQKILYNSLHSNHS